MVFLLAIFFFDLWNKANMFNENKGTLPTQKFGKKTFLLQFATKHDTNKLEQIAAVCYSSKREAQTLGNRLNLNCFPKC